MSEALSTIHDPRSTAAPRLAAPAGGRVDLLIVAGEHSGDEHAARMLGEARTRQPELVVAALGGPRLAAAGAQLLLDLTKSSAIGPGEVLRKIVFFRALIAEIVRWVGEHRPRAVCFVDSSALNLRIAAQLFDRGVSAKAGGPVRTLYCISPQIWASRRGRRFAMAAHLDALAVIFPFEPACYADTALPVTFVGHPFVAPQHRPAVRYDAAGPVLLLPGSRKGAVGRIFPALVAGYTAWGAKREAVVLYPSDAILEVLRTTPVPAGVRFVRTSTVRALGAGAGDRVEADAGAVAASAVLTSSGTMSLECALAGLPGAVVYRTDPVTYLIGRWLVKVPYLGIANLLLGEAMYPEFIQGAARPAALAAELAAAVDDPARIARTQAQATRLRAVLAQPAGVDAGAWLVRELAVRPA